MTTSICGSWFGFQWISSILGDFMWISWIPRGSGAPGLIFYRFHRFYVILGGFVWISWIAGARGQAGSGGILPRSLDPIVSLQDQILR